MNDQGEEGGCRPAERDVGPLERAYFPEGPAKWEQGVGTYWDVAYTNPGVTIYRVASPG